MASEVSFPIRETSAYGPSDPEPCLRVMHLSDLHLTRHEQPGLAAALWYQVLQNLRATLGGDASGTPILSITSMNFVQLFAEAAYAYARDIADGSELVVTNTGDLDDVGSHSGSWPAWSAWQRWLHDQAPAELECLDVYGNHDIWPAWPADHVSHAERPNELAAMISVVRGPYSHSARMGAQFPIHRVNTVNPSPLQGGILALGQVGPEPTGPDEQAAPSPAERSDISAPGFPIVLTHHLLQSVSLPTRNVVKFLIAKARGSSDLLSALRDPIAISGHVHLNYPAIGEQTDTGQLVAAPPAWSDGILHAHDPETRPMMIPEYRIRIDGDSVTVSRAFLRLSRISGRLRQELPPQVVYSR